MVISSAAISGNPRRLMMAAAVMKAMPQVEIDDFFVAL
jgi:hypothetical protein